LIFIWFFFHTKKEIRIVVSFFLCFIACSLLYRAVVCFLVVVLFFATLELVAKLNAKHKKDGNHRRKSKVRKALNNDWIATLKTYHIKKKMKASKTKYK